MAFAEGEPDLPWPESARDLKLQTQTLADLMHRLLGVHSGPRCSIVLDELRSQGQDDTALRHWIGQAEHMLRNEEPPQVLLERAIEDLHLVNEREANQRADSEAKPPLLAIFRPWMPFDTGGVWDDLHLHHDFFSFRITGAHHR